MMATTVTFTGNPVPVAGDFPAQGGKAPALKLTNKDLGDVTLADYTGQRKVVNIFPSIDTPVCAASVRHFNADASTLNNTVVLCVSADLPFAQGRFCGAEGLENVVMLSTMRNAGFMADWGVALGGALEGLCARGVVVLDANDNVLHSELVGEITDEPNYAAALAALA